nr:putative erythromycin esterase [uncultured bacterium]
MARAGMVNVGQLARDRWGDEGVTLVGFSSYEGTVIAGSEWGAPMEEMTVPPATEGTWEAILHHADTSNRLILTGDLVSADLAALTGGPAASGDARAAGRGGFEDPDRPGRRNPASAALDPRGHRAIGVVYDPRSEKYGNYVPSVLPDRYDALIHIDRSQAVRPLHMENRVDGELPETYPFGI